MGVQFASAYKTLGACIAQKSQQAAINAQNAAKQCKAELALTASAFAAVHGGKTFAQQYGVNVNSKNAYGKCVSTRVNAAAQQQLTAEISASKQCKTMMADAAFATAHGGKSFKEFFGSGAQKRNAFGRCVAQLAKAAS
jgi:isopentenyl phosphate kinase